MRKDIQLNIPEPCHVDWNTMTPELKGRHCNVCEKTVFDFTTKTDEYIVKTFEQDNKLCGRFKNSQLNRDLVYNRKDSNNYLTYLASTLFAFIAFGSNTGYAQGGPIKVTQSYSKPIQVKGKTAQSIIKDRLISGTILDENGLPMSGVNIVVKGSSKSLFTDFNGNYTLKAKEDDILIMNSLGYKTKKRVVNNDYLYYDNMEINLNDFNDAHIASDYIQTSNSHQKRKIKSIKNSSHRKQKRSQIRRGEIKRTKIGQFLYTITSIFRKRK